MDERMQNLKTNIRSLSNEQLIMLTLVRLIDAMPRRERGKFEKRILAPELWARIAEGHPELEYGGYFSFE